MAEKIVELRHVNIYQGSNLVLQDVNIGIEKGEFVYLVGKTGTGKSSFAKDFIRGSFFNRGRWYRCRF